MNLLISYQLSWPERINEASDMNRLLKNKDSSSSWPQNARNVYLRQVPSKNEMLEIVPQKNLRHLNKQMWIEWYVGSDYHNNTNELNDKVTNPILRDERLSKLWTKTNSPMVCLKRQTTQVLFNPDHMKYSTTNIHRPSYSTSYPLFYFKE